MNYKLPFCSFLLLAATVAGAQVASHAPTVFKPAPVADGGMVPLAAVGKPVVRVNGSVLTDTDLVREEYSIFPYARQHNGIPKPLEPQIRGGAMKMIDLRRAGLPGSAAPQDDGAGRENAACRGGFPRTVCHAGRIQCT